MSKTHEQPNWLQKTTDNSFEIDGIKFHAPKADGKGKSREDSFAIIKGSQLLNSYAELAADQPKSIFEVGFFEGGSSVFLDRLFKPDQLTCVDIRDDRIEVVDRYIEQSGREDAFRMFYSIDQSDKDTLRRMVHDYHGGSLDLVIDDASHEYFRSKATFEALFPFLKPGSVYMLEDFGWAHTPVYQKLKPRWKRKPPWKPDVAALSNLVFELTMIMSTNAQIISKIEMDAASCRIVRGPMELGNSFSVEDSYISRGKKIRLI